jgi:hypothetical protein
VAASPASAGARSRGDARAAETARAIAPAGSHTSAADVAAALATEITGLANLDAAALRRRWRQVTGRSPGPALKGELLRAALAHALQVRAFGGLSAATLRRLERLVAEGAEAADPARGPSSPRQIKPGSRLLREWQGAMHEVIVLPEGFLWRAETHPSLSAIAKAITGTHWNGWRFFGLKTGPRKNGHAKDGKAKDGQAKGSQAEGGTEDRAGRPIGAKSTAKTSAKTLAKPRAKARAARAKGASPHG